MLKFTLNYYRMQNNIPTLYILKLDSFVVKSTKISTILCLFVQNIKNVDRIAMVTVTQPSEPAFSVDIIQNTSTNHLLMFRSIPSCMKV